MPREFSEDIDRHRPMEIDETLEQQEVDEVSKTAKEIASEASEELERREKIEHLTEEAIKELEELDSNAERAERIARESVKELEGMEEDLGHDIEEVREVLHEEFVNDMKNKLEERSVKETSSESEKSTEDSEAEETVASGESHIEGSDGMVYVMETGEVSESNAELEIEESVDSGKEEAPEVQQTSENPEVAEQEQSVKIHNSIVRPEALESEEAEPKKVETSGRKKERTTIEDYSTNETSVDESKRDHEEKRVVKESQEIEETSSIESREEIREISEEKKDTEKEHLDTSNESRETSSENERAETGPEQDEIIESELTESLEVEDDLELSIEISEETIQHIEEFVEDLVNELVEELESSKEAEADESRIIVDAMTGKEHIDRSLEFRPYFEETGEEIEQSEQTKVKEKIDEMFTKISEEERETFKKSIRSKLKTENLDEWVKRNSSVKASPDYKEKYKDAKKHLRGKRKGKVPKLIKELWKDEVERVWSKFVLRAMNLKLRLKKIESTNEGEHIPWEIKTITQFQLALQYHNELKFWETFDEQYEKVQNYFNGKLRRKPKILGKLESLELERSYELAKGSPLKISIETKQDIEKLQSKYGTLSSKDWEICKKYLEITDNWTLTIEELSSLYGISKAMVNRWRNGSEPPPIAKLRQWEEERILKEWTTLKEFQPMSRTSHLSPRVELYNAPKQYRIGKQLEQRVKIIQGLRAKSDVVINTDDVGIGFDSGRIYFWEKSTSLDLIDLYKGSFFYFTDKNKLAQFVMNIKQTQNLNDSSKGLHGTLTHLNKILSQLFPQKHSETYINLRYNRIKGGQLRFLINLSSWSITDLEQSISKIAGVFGRGGITNPRFPQGSKLEKILTRVVSIVISDSNLKSNGVITYHEPDIKRIQIVEKYLQALGDIQLKPTYDKRTNHYITYLSAVIGKALIKLGLTPGNKTIHNPGLFPLIFTFSWDTLCALIEELVPQDGSVKPYLISWGHSHTLYIDTKETGISFKPLISQEEVDFVIEHGKPYEHYKRLPMGKLERLTKDKNRNTSRVATKLLNHIYNNPNNLIEYEAQIATILGVKVVKKPVSVFYQKRTGAVTVAWVVRTVKKIEALRLAMIAPPNDVRKRRVMRKSILNNPEAIEKILSDYADRGIEIRRWWKEEEVNGGSGET